MSDIVNGAKSLRMALQYFLSALSDSVQDDDSRIRVSGLYEPWTAGKYEAGDIRNAGGQTWECFQAHDNATYPDIKPGTAAWYTFWRPLHGKSPETAGLLCRCRARTTCTVWGKYMVWTDGSIKRATQDTAYSPEDYPQAWENVE